VVCLFTSQLLLVWIVLLGVRDSGVQHLAKRYMAA